MPKTTVKIRFGTMVRAWRNQVGVSQEELAARAGLHRTYVSDVERGARNVSLESIHKLAAALEVSVARLFLPAEHPSGASSLGRPAADELVDILLVEDNPDDVALTLDALEAARITNRVHVARDGAEALDFLFGNETRDPGEICRHPQMILLDLGLPKIGGLEVLRRVRADERTRRIPVVVLTASRQDRDIATSRRLGAEAYIIKPVDFQNLGEVTPRLNLQWALLKPIQTPALAG